MLPTDDLVAGYPSFQGRTCTHIVLELEDAKGMPCKGVHVHGGTPTSQVHASAHSYASPRPMRPHAEQHHHSRLKSTARAPQVPPGGWPLQVCSAQASAPKHSLQCQSAGSRQKRHLRCGLQPGICTCHMMSGYALLCLRPRLQLHCSLADVQLSSKLRAPYHLYAFTCPVLTWTLAHVPLGQLLKGTFQLSFAREEGWVVNLNMISLQESHWRQTRCI